MRTTLTIDDDVMAKLRTRAFVEKDRSFKEIVNDTLRLGLNVRETVARQGSSQCGAVNWEYSRI